MFIHNNNQLQVLVLSKNTRFVIKKQDKFKPSCFSSCARGALLRRIGYWVKRLSTRDHYTITRSTKWLDTYGGNPPENGVPST